MMAGEGGQDRDSIFIRDQLEGVCKALRRPVKFRAKPPVLFAKRLEPPVHTGYFLRISADKEFALQIDGDCPLPPRLEMSGSAPA